MGELSWFMLECVLCGKGYLTKQARVYLKYAGVLSRPLLVRTLPPIDATKKAFYN